MKYSVIVNPTSGHGEGAKFTPSIEQMFKKFEMNFVLGKDS